MQEIESRTFLMRYPETLVNELFAVRLEMGLPCIQGVVTIESLKIEDIRASVAAFFFMIMRKEMPKEPVHFGLGECTSYSMVHLLATQKPDNFTSLFHFNTMYQVLSVGEVPIMSYAKQFTSFLKEITIIKVNDLQISCIDVVEVEGEFSEVICPVVADQIFCNKIDVDLDTSLGGEASLEKFVMIFGRHIKGDSFQVIMPKYNALWDLEAIYYSDMNVSIRVQNSESLFVRVSGRHADGSSNVLKCYVIENGEWNIRLIYRIKYTQYAKYVPRPSTFFSEKCEKKIRDYFSFLG